MVLNGKRGIGVRGSHGLNASGNEYLGYVSNESSTDDTVS